MLLVLCIDLDDDLGRKTDFETPVIGRDEVEAAAVALAEDDPEDSDVNVLFKGINIFDATTDEPVEVAAVTGAKAGGVAANRAIGAEVDTVLASLATSEEVAAYLVTDGAQDESVVPVIRSRINIDGTHRVVVRQAQDLESMYYTIKQVLNDPETRGTILVPLGILLLIYPLAIVAEALELPGSPLGGISALLGLYILARGLGAEETLDTTVERVRTGLYTGRVTVITYVVAAALVIIGGVSGFQALEAAGGESTSISKDLATFVDGALTWVAAAGITSSFGRVTDEYIAGEFEWRYLNAPFYVVAIATVLHGLSQYFLHPEVGPPYVAAALTIGTVLGLGSTLLFAVAESQFDQAEPA